MMKFVRGRLASFRPAFAGMAHVLRTQPNAWVHTIVSVSVIVVGLWLGVDIGSWGLLILAMGLVWASEFFNTGMEAIVDLASPSQHELAKVAKDVSAAAVVVAVIIAVVIGLLVLGLPLWARLLGQ